MNKKSLFGSLLMAALLAAGCGPTKTQDTVKPMLMGLETTKTCEAGTTVNLLEGITATDDVDGDITSKIDVSITPELPISNGVVTLSVGDVGEYDITYTVKDAAGNEEIGYSALVVTPAFGEKELVKEYSFELGTEGWSPDIVDGNGIVGTKGIEKGRYVFNISENPNKTDWHIKYPYYNYPVEAGHTYEITATIYSNKGGQIMFNGAPKTIEEGKNEVKVVMESAFTGFKNIEIQFGLIEAPFKTEIESIVIKDSAKAVDEDKTVTVDKILVDADEPIELTEGWAFNKDDWHCEASTGEGADFSIEKNSDDATVTVNVGEKPAWAGKFLVQTKNKLLKGIQYSVEITYESNNDLTGLEFGYGDWGDDFKALKELYDVTLTANTPKKFEFNCTSAIDFDNPMICLKMGNAPAGTTVKASGFKVTYQQTLEDIDLSRDGVASVWQESRDTSLIVKEKNKVTATTKGAAVGAWQASTDIELKNLNLSADKTYRIGFDVKTSADVEAFRIMAGASDWDPNSLADTQEFFMKGNENFAFSIVKKLDADIEDFKIRVKYGQATADTVVTVSDLKIEQIDFVEATAENLLPADWAFNDSQDEFKAYGDGDNVPTVVKTANDVTFTSIATGGCWTQKAIIEPRVSLVKGNKYHLAITIVANGDFTGVEVGAGYMDGDYKQFGHTYDVAMAAQETRLFEFTYLADANSTDNWGFGIWMGTLEIGTSLKVTGIVVERVPEATSNEETTFNFLPKNFNHYADESKGASSELYVENGELVYDIKKIAHDLDYANKLWISPITLEANYKYTIEIVAKADKNFEATAILNVLNKWDPRVSETVNLTTEYSTISLEISGLSTEMQFELLFQGMDVNACDAAKVTFKSAKIFRQAPIEA